MESSSSAAPKVDTAAAVLYFLAGALLPTIAYAFLRGGRRGALAEREEEEDDSDDDSDNLPEATGDGPSSTWDIQHAPYKMVFCVNTSLSMGKGKIAAQVGHAAVGCYKRSRKQCPKAVAAWERSGCAKIALKCPTEEDLEEIAIRALAKDIPCYLVEDAGRTQIAAGSRTVLGLGPAPVSVFEDVTSHLKLM
jgi:PTH2 family peptidyl-tRNA hydrolase